MKNPETNKGTKNMTVKKLLTVLTAALLIVLPMQGLSAANANGVDVSLSTFEINGSAVEDGDVLIVPNGTTSVTVVATPTDLDATADVTGDTGLISGDNDVVVTVTGSDGLTTGTYTVDVFVTTQAPEFSTDTTLSSLKVNGSTITAGQTVEVAPLTTAVVVEAVTTDANATSVVTGAINLVTGNNTVTVTVTAEDGTTTHAYTFKVRVIALSTDVALATFTVNGQAVRNGGRLYLEPGTTAVSVVATPSDSTSSVNVVGATGLLSGTNTLAVTVTSLSGTDATYNVTLNVQTPSSISSLVVFKVSGARVTDAGTVILPSGTTAVAVTAIPSDAGASVAVTGNADLILGDNDLSVVVTAEDGTTTTYTQTLRVLANDDTSLAVFQYDGSDVADGDSFDLENGTAAVEVTAEATTKLSSVEILGADALVVGKNIVRINVTAQDTSVRTYRLIFNVAPNTDTSLESVTVGGQDASGGSVTLPAGTRAAAVLVVTTDPYATFAVEGNTELNTGDNDVTVTVTAADGETTEDVVITVTVSEPILGTDTSLESVTVGGQDASGGSVTLPAGTRAAAVIAVTTDAYASYVVEGNTELVPGEQTVTITVTAADGETTDDVSISVTVEEVILSNEVGVTSITVAGQDGLAGAVNVGLGTQAVLVQVVTTDPYATFAVDGNTDLAPGENVVTVTVTAADGETTADYTVAVMVPELSDDSSYSLFEINGAEVNDGDAISLASGTTRVNVNFAVTDAGATYSIAGDGKTTPLVEGDNDLVVTVTAANGDSSDYTVTLTVLALSQNADLAEEEAVSINGEAIDAELINSETGFYNLPLSTTRITVGVKAMDAGADVFVNDKTVWPTVARQFSVEQGVNEIEIQVVPAAGTEFAKTYTVKVYVGGDDATVKTVKVNSTVIAITDNAGALATELANGTKNATIFVDPTVAYAVGAGNGTKIEFDGGDVVVTKAAAANTWNLAGLVTGENAITFTITPGDANAEPATYTVTIPVALSSDKGLKAFKINGVTVVVGSTYVVAKGDTSAELDAETNSEFATFEVSGTDELVLGLNTAVITVTAEDGTTAEYKVTVVVPKDVHTIVVGFPKVGIVAVDAKANKAGNAILVGEIKKLTTAKAKVVKVTITNNFLIKKDKPTAGPARAAAIQKYLTTDKTAIKVIGLKTLKYDLIAGATTQKGTTVVIYYY
jgi:tRNA threonylcarbamoyladenosine modification (KEOPS) complex  Pcc1 subunit